MWCGHGSVSISCQWIGKICVSKKEKSCRKDDGRKAVEALAKEARKNGLLLSSSGTVKSSKANNFASMFTDKGQKGVNKDCLIVSEEFGCQEDMTFCGVFDGHGPRGHYVANRVRKLVLASLLCNLRENLAPTSLGKNFKMELDRNLHGFDIWKKAYKKTFAAIDQDLKQHAGIDSFQSGTTALTVIKQVIYIRVILVSSRVDTLVFMIIILNMINFTSLRVEQTGSQSVVVLALS